jgi:hypothetical protein
MIDPAQLRFIRNRATARRKLLIMRTLHADLRRHAAAHDAEPGRIDSDQKVLNQFMSVSSFLGMTDSAPGRW